MLKNAQVINLPDKIKRVKLSSGREVVIDHSEKEELIRIIEKEGQISLTVRMTEAGPVITIEGAQLALKSVDKITLEAKKIEMVAEEETTIASKGALNIESEKKMDIKSKDDIRVEGKLIHLN